jgi:hypothetical protein
MAVNIYGGSLEMSAGELIFDCPWCGGSVVVARREVNCRIFRHAVRRVDGVAVNPHMREEEMRGLLATQAVWGCGNPFRLVGEELRAERGEWSD